MDGATPADLDDRDGAGRSGIAAAAALLAASAAACGARRGRRCRRWRTQEPAAPAAAAIGSRVLAVVRLAGDSAKQAPSPAAEDAYGGWLVQVTLFLIYFCLQGTLSFYMAWLLSKAKVSENLVGIPASFLVTSSQQMVGFCCFVLLLVCSRLIGKPYVPKALAPKEIALVLGLSMSFALNIGLNLCSLVLIPLSLNLIVRGCLPLSTAVTQTLLLRQKQDISAGEWGCMIFGVICACVVAIAQSGGAQGAVSPTFFLGLACSLGSITCGSLDMVIKALLGSNIKLSSLDTTCYMAIPVAVFTGLIGLVPKPLPGVWAAQVAPRMSDFAVFAKIWDVDPKVFLCVAVSGLFAFFYNVFQTFMVVRLSPATTAFAGNFNKAALILLSVLLFDGRLPPGARGQVAFLAIIGNIASFTLYNVLARRRKNRQ